MPTKSVTRKSQGRPLGAVLPDVLGPVLPGVNRALPAAGGHQGATQEAQRAPVDGALGYPEADAGHGTQAPSCGDPESGALHHGAEDRRLVVYDRPSREQAEARHHGEYDWCYHISTSFFTRAPRSGPA